MSFQICMTHFRLWNTKEDILKNVSTVFFNNIEKLLWGQPWCLWLETKLEIVLKNDSLNYAAFENFKLWYDNL